MTAYVLSLMKVVIDTNVLVGALLSGAGSNRKVIELSFKRIIQPQLANPLYLEYEEVFERSTVLEKCRLNETERSQFLDDFLSVCRWSELYYTWRPNLKDEGDNHLIEVAVASGATYIVTHNVRDFRAAELRFDDLEIVTPSALLEKLL